MSRSTDLSNSSSSDDWVFCNEIKQKFHWCHHFLQSFLKEVAYIDVDAIAIENGSLWMIWGYVAVELVAISIPLYGVEFVAFEIIFASESGILSPNGVRWNVDID